MIKKLWNGRVKLPVLCYGLCLVGWLVLSLFGLGRDAVLKATGSLQPFTLPMEVWQTVNLEKADGDTWLTLTDDPQMHWQNDQNVTVRSLRMEASFSKSAREMCLYYTTRAGEDFGQEKRVFAVQQQDGSYLYTLPAGRITALRLDPCSARGLEMTITGIYVNEPQSIIGYFAPGWYGAFRMVLWPAMAAAALSVAGQAYQTFKKSGRGQKKAR